MISKRSIHRVTAIAFCTLWITISSTGANAQGVGYVPWVGNDAEGQKCTGGQPEAGPYDYLQRQRLAADIRLVEQFHFNEDVEKLRKGMTTTPMGDINYTLKAVPNHHRALRSAVNYRLKLRHWPKGPHNGEKAECYLQRAIAFSPNDPTLYPLLAYVLHRLKHPGKALYAYQKAVETTPNDMMLKYNMGLALTDLKRYTDAKEVATAIYATDFPLQGLKNRLIAVGRWEENVTSTINGGDTQTSNDNTPRDSQSDNAGSSEAASPEDTNEKPTTQATDSATESTTAPDSTTQSDATTDSTADKPEQAAATSATPETAPTDKQTDKTASQDSTDTNAAAVARPEEQIDK